MEKKKTESQASANMPTTVVALKKNRGKLLMFASIALMLMAFSALGITLAYFAANATAGGTITLGDPVQISVTQGGASVSSLTFSGTALPGTVYSQPIGFSVPAASSDCVLRAKFTITNTDGASISVDATPASGWTAKHTDEYYYYEGVATASFSGNLITAITVPTALTNEDANKTFTVNVILEAIQHANGAAAAVWTTAPSTWLDDWGSGTTP